jgi:hypothetical protein
VTDHVGIGIVHDNHVEATGVYRLNQLVCYLVSRHFRLLVVCGDPGGGHQDSALARKLVLASTVEEERDVRVFFGLGDAKLGQPRLRDHLAESVLEILGRKQHRQELIELLRVFRHSQCCRKFHGPGSGESEKTGVKEGAQNLPHAVGPEVGHQHTVTVSHALIGTDPGRQHELVALAGGIGLSDRGIRALRRATFAIDEAAVGFLDPVPTLVAVHRKIAAGDGGKFGVG